MKYLILFLPALAMAGDAINQGDSLAPTPISRVQDEGTSLTRRKTINFTGTGVTCADNSASSRTDCTINGGGASDPNTVISASAPLVDTAGNLTIPKATGSVDGYLDHTDWTTFNGKDAVITASAPIVRTTNNLTCTAATGSVAGCLSSADWTTFNAKQATIAVTAPVVLTGVTLSMPSATTSVDGYLNHTDWTTFNAKQATIAVSAPITLSGATVGSTAAASSVAGHVTTATQVFTGEKQFETGIRLLAGTNAYFYPATGSLYMKAYADGGSSLSFADSAGNNPLAITGSSTTFYHPAGMPITMKSSSGDALPLKWVKTGGSEVQLQDVFSGLVMKMNGAGFQLTPSLELAAGIILRTSGPTIDSSSGKVIITSKVADGASAIAEEVNTSGTTLSTAGAEIFDFKNNTTTKAAVNRNGGYQWKVSPTLDTCGSAYEGLVERQKGGTSSVRTELCLCTSDGAGTPAYAWQNISGTFASAAAALGTSTTCPDTP